MWHLFSMLTCWSKQACQHVDVSALFYYIVCFLLTDSDQLNMFCFLFLFPHQVLLHLQFQVLLLPVTETQLLQRTDRTMSVVGHWVSRWALSEPVRALRARWGPTVEANFKAVREIKDGVSPETHEELLISSVKGCPTSAIIADEVRAGGAVHRGGVWTRVLASPANYTLTTHYLFPVDLTHVCHLLIHFKINPLLHLIWPVIHPLIHHRIIIF